MNAPFLLSICFKMGYVWLGKIEEVKMNKLILFLCVTPVLLVEPKSSRLLDNVSDNMMEKLDPTYKAKTQHEKNKIKLEHAKCAKKALQLKHLIDVEDLYSAGHVIGDQLRSLDREYSAAAVKLDKQIHGLERDIKNYAGEIDSRWSRVKNRVRSSSKAAWNKVKSGYNKVKTKITGSKKRSNEESAKTVQPEAVATKKSAKKSKN